jgi:diaminopimelate epimerase
MQLRFTKMHGLGNDFVVIDGITQDVSLQSGQIKMLADRKTGIGCDQLLLIEPPSQTNVDFKYRIFNADGSEVEHCGNGVRCVAKYVTDKRLTGKKEILVETCNREVQLNLLGNNMVRVDMGAPEFEPQDIPLDTTQRNDLYTLETELGQIEFGSVSMGNPHAVILVEDTENCPIDTLGPIMEAHPFFPKRVNVGFMQIVNRNTIQLRVFERGVGETLACGTGACAAVVSGRIRGLLDSRVTAKLLGGSLEIEWDAEGQPVYMTGSAVKVFDGKIRL